MDIGWAMDRSKGMTWMTFPRSNFGLFIVKGHPRSAHIFKRAWMSYESMPAKNKKIVAKDQSIIHEAMRIEHHRTKYNFSYFFPGFLFLLFLYLVGLYSAAAVLDIPDLLSPNSIPSILLISSRILAASSNSRFAAASLI